MAKLVEMVSGVEYPLEGSWDGRYRIGTGSSNTIRPSRVDDYTHIARWHAHVEQRDGKWHLIAYMCEGLTYLTNDSKPLLELDPEPLSDKDEIHFCKKPEGFYNNLAKEGKYPLPEERFTLRFIEE